MTHTAEAGPSLLNSFLATQYRVDVGDPQLVITIGALHAELDRALGHRSWHLISAHNPDARRLDPMSNRQRHQGLVAVIKDAGMESWPAVNRSSGNWPDELGRLIVGAPAAWVHARAREFGQVAVVAGQPGRPARLWVYRSERLPGTHPHLDRIDSWPAC